MAKRNDEVRDLVTDWLDQLVCGDEKAHSVASNITVTPKRIDDNNIQLKVQLVGRSYPRYFIVQLKEMT